MKISSLITSDRLEGISYDDLVSEVKDFYDPKPSIIVQRYQFYTRERTGTETIATYVAALRKLAEHCSYGDKLNEMIRDRLVCGVNHATIQPRLLAEKDLTYEKAIELAQAVEAAEKNTKILSSKPTLHRYTTAIRKWQQLTIKVARPRKPPLPRKVHQLEPVICVEVLT